ncbi:hypothetical protein D1646_09700 [Pseudoflavonifractor sp. 60]|uniref:hypothetical protein n=1 Tax=Pseudoflavonifractor sp. 60 TaxID=2304576 RepID=UPI001367CDCB|nr:hypothetical protein [Pseudoflavonifractor sp. 60]NBI67088.1 hypothetical protein [Pseudoflavonifractor sp. 60]
MRRFAGILLACTLALSCSFLPSGAVEVFDDFPAIARVSGRVNQAIPANMTVYLDEFTLTVDDIIRYDCVYTPRFASVDFGYIAPDGKFYSKNCTSGSINRSFQVDNAGTYTLAIRNNSSNTVTVTGTVKY